MNIRQIKENIDLKSFLVQHFNFRIERSSGVEHWGKSPFRSELTASFRVNDKYQCYTDFGESDNRRSGDVIQFVTIYFSCNVAQAIMHISRLLGHSFSFPQHDKSPISKLDEKKENASLIIDSVLPRISNPSLKAFLNRKRIHAGVYDRYLQEVHFHHQSGRQYFGVGFKNDNGGYEVAYQIWSRKENCFSSIKLCLGRKDVTFIDHSVNSLLITESWSDFLAFISCYPKAEYKNDFLILNSVSMANKIQTLDRHTTIYSLLDNDDAGQNLTKKIVQIYPDRAVPLNHLYLEYKDFNEYWIHLKS